MCRVALLIDAENISITNLEEIYTKAQQEGSLGVAKIFADWIYYKGHQNSDGAKNWRDTCREISYPFELVQVYNIAGKNSTDAAIIIAAMELLYEEEYDTFCIASSDSDFIGLVRRLRKSGKRVVGFVESQVNEVYTKSFDQFHQFNNSIPTQKELIEEEKKFILNAINYLRDNNMTVNSPNLGNRLIQKDANLYSKIKKEHGSLQNIIKAIEKNGEVILDFDQKEAKVKAVYKKLFCLKR